MYLKRVELLGFKSFYQKTELEFGPGIAVVVGPNGCGKSNLADAIRWALGEQSIKSLRGGRMEEIIFAGTQKCKPLNLAEVSLTFAGVGSTLNLDYDEITVTRRLYRSGESEYLLNKTPCRLKDITGLFIDTGVGKELYSIIGQGRMEEIINSRPEERREIFEEAAGILKYKLQKKEAQRRLEETGDNMTRVRDLIYELETQIAPLKEQAELAAQYRSLEEEANSLKREILSYRICYYEDCLKKVGYQLERSEGDLAAAMSVAGQGEKTLFEFKQRIGEQERVSKSREQAQNELLRGIEQLEGKERLLEERKSRFREQIRESSRLHRNGLEEWEKLTGVSREWEVELEQKQLAAGEEQKRSLRLEQDLKELEQGSLFRAVERQQQSLLEVTSGYNAAETIVRELELQVARGEKKEGPFLREEGEIRGKLKDITAVQKETDFHMQALLEQGAALENRHREILQRIDESRLQLETIRRKQQTEREEFRALDSRFQLLKEQEADRGGYFRGVKAVLQAAKNGRPPLTGIIGPVADLIEVEDRYLRAVEVILSSGLQYIVTSTAKAAREAIRFLKEKNLGRATFLPLDTIRVMSSPLDRYPRWIDREGALGKLAEFVTTDPSYRRVIDFLLGNVALCGDLNAASEVARFIKYSSPVVSLDGEVISPGGSLRGGSLPRRSGGLLGRRHEIEAIQKERAEIKRRLDEASQQANHQEEHISAGTAQLETVEHQLKEHRQELERLKKSVEVVSRNRDLLKGRLEDAESARREHLEEQKGLAARLESARQQAKELKLELSGVQDALAGERGLYEQDQAQIKRLEKELTECLVALSARREQENSLQSKLAQMAARKQELTGELERWQARTEKTNLALKGNLAEQRLLQGQLQQQRKQLALLSNEVEKSHGMGLRLRSELAELEAAEEKGRNRRQRLGKRKQQLDLEQARLQGELKLWNMRYSEIFGEGERLPANPASGFDPEPAERKLNNLNDELSSLGEVNLGAIDELKRLQERIAFLNRQLDDLSSGEQSINQVLEEINRHMARYFMQTLDLINNNFLKVFADLFGGGRAYLELTDPDHLLESGVEIVAQPPGKKLQSITLLSTGEKVLTALALTFSILLHKPAPFYLLDEVESSLDETNLGKFNRYLQRLSRQAQFILITHRKGTMETADIIYGVTMSEPGVTKMVSLKIGEKAG